MKKSIVVCDSDEAYVRAFAAYLMERIEGISISSFTSEEAFLASDEFYSIGILSKDFLSVLEFAGKGNVQEKFYLCDDVIACEYEHLPMVYKYQSMEVVEEMLKRMQKKEKDAPTPWWNQKSGHETNVVGIYSPISHELQLPFALSIAQIYREQGSVLFLDLEEISILQMLTNQTGNRNFVDLLYLFSQDEVKQEDITCFTSSFMGIDYVNPFSGPEEMADVERDTWISFMKQVVKSGYDTVVILFGRAIRGFSEIITGCRQFIVLGRAGDYYKKSQDKFVQYIKERCKNVCLQEVYLPMSAGNLVDGTYAIEELVQGNLGMFVRRFLQKEENDREKLSCNMTDVGISSYGYSKNSQVLSYGVG